MNLDEWIIVDTNTNTNTNINEPKIEEIRSWSEYFDKIWNVTVIFGIGSIIYFYTSRTNSSSKF
jgi:hypothetical protein